MLAEFAKPTYVTSDSHIDQKHDNDWLLAWLLKRSTTPRLTCVYVYLEITRRSITAGGKPGHRNVPVREGRITEDILRSQEEEKKDFSNWFPRLRTTLHTAISERRENRSYSYMKQFWPFYITFQRIFFCFDKQTYSFRHMNVTLSFPHFHPLLWWWYRLWNRTNHFFLLLPLWPSARSICLRSTWYDKHATHVPTQPNRLAGRHTIFSRNSYNGRTGKKEYIFYALVVSYGKVIQEVRKISERRALLLSTEKFSAKSNIKEGRGILIENRVITVWRIERYIFWLKIIWRDL